MQERAAHASLTRESAGRTGFELPPVPDPEAVSRSSAGIQRMGFDISQPSLSSMCCLVRRQVRVRMRVKIRLYNVRLASVRCNLNPGRLQPICRGSGLKTLSLLPEPLPAWATYWVNSGSTSQRQNTRTGPRRIWLNQAVLKGSASWPETPAFTFNPKVAGSIPARPIEIPANRTVSLSDLARSTAMGVRGRPTGHFRARAK